MKGSNVMKTKGDQKKTNDPKSYSGWFITDEHPLELMSSKKWDELKVYAEYNQDILISLFLKGDRNNLATTIKDGVFFLNITEDSLRNKKRDRAIFALGKTKGTLSFLARILGNEAQSKRTEAIVESRLSGIKNLDVIILILEKDGPLTHSELAKKMGGMNLSTLTENMKKISSYGLVLSQSSGKYKYYSLSNTGRAYAFNLRKRTKSTSDIVNVRRELESLINDKNTRMATISMIQQVFGESYEYSSLMSLIKKMDDCLVDSTKDDNGSQLKNTKPAKIYDFPQPDKNSKFTNSINQPADDRLLDLPPYNKFSKSESVRYAHISKTPSTTTSNSCEVEFY